VFIENTKEYGNNFVPQYDFIILVKFDYEIENPMEDDELWKTIIREAREKLNAGLDISLDKISVKNGGTVSNLDDRFDEGIHYSPINKFYDFTIELPSLIDLQFLMSLQQNGFTSNDFDKEQLEKTIDEIKEKLNQ